MPDNWSIGHAQENDMRNNQHQSPHKVLCSGPKQQLKCITLQSLAQLVVPPCCCPTKKPTQVENRPHHHQHETVWLWSGWVADAGVAQKPNGKPPSSSTPTTDPTITTHTTHKHTKTNGLAHCRRNTEFERSSHSITVCLLLVLMVEWFVFWLWVARCCMLLHLQQATAHARIPKVSKRHGENSMMMGVVCGWDRVSVSLCPLLQPCVLVVLGIHHANVERCRK